MGQFSGLLFRPGDCCDSFLGRAPQFPELARSGSFDACTAVASTRLSIVVIAKNYDRGFVGRTDKYSLAFFTSPFDRAGNVCGPIGGGL